MSDFPDDLVQAQCVLEAARAAYVSFRRGLSGWVDGLPERAGADGAVVPAVAAWSEEERVEERRLLEAERQAAHAVLYHPWWGTVEKSDRVKAMERLRAAAAAGLAAAG